MLSFYLSLIDTVEDKDKVLYLYNNFYSYMIYCASQIMTENTSDVEDVVHDAMISLMDHLSIIDFKDEIKVRNFCGIVARNKAIDHCRKIGAKATPMGEIFVAAINENDDPEAIVINKDTYESVLKAINNLDEKYRDVCLLKYVNDLNDTEISDVLNIPLKTVNTRVYRSKQILKDALRKGKCHV